MKKINPLPSLVLASNAFFGLFLAFPFVFHVMVLVIAFYSLQVQKSHFA
jgi:hypothetical protein